MKKIMLMALAGFTFFSAEARNHTSTGCKVVKSDKASMKHHDKYAENFKVCKNDAGYHICGEEVSNLNATKPVHYMPSAPQHMTYNQGMDVQPMPATDPNAMLAPQSQSYPSAYAVNETAAYESFAPKKHFMTVSYNENVAEENRAPYEGLPSPQYDGPAKNAQRNLNESNPNANLAPITGRKE